jgi:S1-C subfamily serine protease
MRFPQEDVSSSHAKLGKTNNGEIYIVDNNSSNGTFVNGSKVQQQKLNPGDRVLLANKYPLEWEGLLAGGTQHGSSRKPVAQNDESGNTNRKALITGISVVAGIGALVLLYFLVIKDLTTSKPQNIIEKYENSVVLVVHGYVYLVEFEGLGWAKVTISGENFAPYAEGRNSPLFASGTGFFIDNEARIITNRHVALPWDYDDQKRILMKLVNHDRIKFWNDFVAIADKNVTAPMVDNAELKITGESIKIGLALNNTFFEWENLKNCKVLKESGKKEVDVAMMQVSDKQLPPQVTNIVDLSEAFTDYESLKGGEDLYLLGYPLALDWANTREGIKVTFQDGRLNRKPDDLRVGYNISTAGGASGSPVFNSKGQLVAIHNMGWKGKADLNSGILSIYAIKLLRKYN